MATLENRQIVNGELRVFEQVGDALKLKSIADKDGKSVTLGALADKSVAEVAAARDR